EAWLHLHDASNMFKFAFDAPGVGTRYSGFAEADFLQIAAFEFMVDQSNVLLFRDLNYYFNYIERMGGISWLANEALYYGGNYGGFGQGGFYQSVIGIG